MVSPAHCMLCTRILLPSVSGVQIQLKLGQKRFGLLFSDEVAGIGDVDMPHSEGLDKSQRVT